MVVGDRAKPMADVGGRPFLDLLIDYVSAFGARRFILGTGHKAESVTRYYDQVHGARQVLISHESEPLGTAGAVKNAESLLRSDPFLVMNGDSFCPANLLGFLEFHFRKEAELSIALVPVEDARDFGAVQLDISQRITRFQEKGIGTERALVSAGMYLFAKGILAQIPAGRKCSLEYDLFPACVERRSYGFIADAELIDIGTPERYSRARKVLSGKGSQ